MPPPPWGYWRHLLRLGVGDELSIADRIVVDSELEQSVEDEAPASRGAAVESEDELVDSIELARERPGERAPSVWRT